LARWAKIRTSGVRARLKAAEIRKNGKNLNILEKPSSPNYS
jgi:hypothetical protein